MEGYAYEKRNGGHRVSIAQTGADLRIRPAGARGLLHASHTLAVFACRILHRAFEAAAAAIPWLLELRIACVLPHGLQVAMDLS